MKLLSPIPIVLLAGLALLVGGYVAFWSFFFSGCDGNEEAAQRMRTLPEKRLESLFLYTKERYGDGKIRSPIIFDIQQAPIPSELADLKPKSIQFFGGAVGVHVSGCMDDKVYLFVHGLDPDDREPKILLSPGENQASELIWQQ